MRVEVILHQMIGETLRGEATPSLMIHQFRFTRVENGMKKLCEKLNFLAKCQPCV